MKKVIVAFVSLAIPMMAFASDPYQLRCEDNRIENDLLKQAPHGAKRTGKHVLEIKYSGGVRKFIDKPPYDELVDGINTEGLSWEYCGYNEIVKAHLILKRDNVKHESYTGSLLFEDTGKIVKAGYSVTFSPNKLNFIAFQRYGGDGEFWDLFDTSGHKLWREFSYIILPVKPTDSYSQEVAEFENPTLSNDLEIKAHMTCWQSKKSGNVTLKKIGAKWVWHPKIEC
jgi:hypothetical protein